VQPSASERLEMRYRDFLTELRKAGLSVRAFAKLIGMNPNSVSNYASIGEVPKHLSVIAALLAEMSIQGIAFRPAVERVNSNPQRPRGRGRPGRFGGDKQEQFSFDSDRSV
jgi:lambda repressor-like predicted transcriptional regulator